MDQQFRNLLTIYGVTFLYCCVILVARLNYGAYILSEPSGVCRLWCIEHFVMYVFLGYFAPNYWYLSFMISILWEYLEETMNQNGLPVQANLTKDVITNSVGLFTGMFLKFNL